MIPTKVPFGSINEDLIDHLLPKPEKDGKFMCMDKYGSYIELDPAIYDKLEKGGLDVYDGRIEKAGISQL